MSCDAEASERSAAWECAICLELLCEPLQLPCTHCFCRRCLEAACHHTNSCPLCRTDFPDAFNASTASVHKPLEMILIRAATVEYHARLDEVTRAAAGLVQLRVSNTLEAICCYPHFSVRWTVHVDLERDQQAVDLASARLPDLISAVRFGLKPAWTLVSCGVRHACEGEQTPAYAEASAAPYQLTAVSVAAFKVPIVIIWKDWLGQPPLRLEHQLDFSCDGAPWSYGVELGDAFAGRKAFLDDVAFIGSECGPLAACPPLLSEHGSRPSPAASAPRPGALGSIMRQIGSRGVRAASRVRSFSLVRDQRRVLESETLIRFSAR